VAMQIYQDIWINGVVKTKGVRDCESRYEPIQALCKKYKRPISVLDIGANLGYYSSRLSSEYGCTSVMVEGAPVYQKALSELIVQQNCRNKLILLGTHLDLKKVKEMSKCEHFDIVLALRVVHHFKEPFDAVIEAIVSLGDHIFFELPTASEDKVRAMGRVQKELADHSKVLSPYKFEKVGEYPIHVGSDMSPMYLVENPKTGISQPFMGSPRKIEHTIISTFDDKKMVKNDPLNRGVLENEWVPGINLLTYHSLNGLYPPRKVISEQIAKYPLPEGSPLTDIRPWNFILGGTSLTLIDHTSTTTSLGTQFRDNPRNCMANSALFINANIHPIHAMDYNREPEQTEVWLKQELAKLKKQKTQVHTERYTVSAIVSAYNAERFIHGRLQNLLNQTLFKKNQLEIIVVDSNSPQNERSIVESFMKYGHVVLIRTSERETVSRAWNRGVQMASGKYIINADADDRFSEYALEKMANELDSNPNIHAVYGDWQLTGTENDTLDSDQKRSAFHYPPFFPPMFFYFQTTSYAPLLRKDIFEKIGFYNDELEVFADREFMMRFSASGLKAKKLPHILGLHLEHPAGLKHLEGKTGAMEFTHLIDRFLAPEPFARLFGHDSVPDKGMLSQLYADLGSLGKSLFGIDNRPEARIFASEKLFAKALETDNRNVTALNNMGILSCLRGQQQQGLQLLERAVESGKEDQKSAIQANLDAGKRGSTVFDDYNWFEPENLNFQVQVRN